MKDYNATNNNEIFNQKTNSNQIIISCWNCLNRFHSYTFQEVAKCPKCSKYNRVPNSNISQNLNNFSNYIEINDLDKIISCPFCYTKNIFQREADELLCYKCGNNIKQCSLNSHQLNSQKEDNRKIIGWKIVPSQQTILTPPVVSPNPVSTSLQIESNTDYLLKKILKNLKKQKNFSDINAIQPSNYNPFPSPPYFFPYPFADYFISKRSRNIDDEFGRERNNKICTSEIRYIPIKTENNKPNSNGYKITIRKKHGFGKEISKSTIFEKVFYLK